MAAVPVPEASVYKYRCLVFWKDKVGRAGQISGMEPVPVSHFVQGFPDGNFRLRILASDSGHHRTALFFRYYICHC
jgi:hypothetical protein